MNCIENFPYKNVILRWLKARYIDNNAFCYTDTGTSQGSLISPLLANIALHGMEEELGIKYRYVAGKGYRLKIDSLAVVRFADDFVVLCKSKEEAESIYVKLQPYLEKRKIKLAEDKTRITHINDGFDFLGFNIRKYKTKSGAKLLIKPSKESIKKARQKIKDIFIQYRGRPIGELIYKLNPVIRGIGNYWSSVVASKVFSMMDSYIWFKIRKYLKRLHPNKSEKWIFERYLKPDCTGVSKNKCIPTDPKDEQNQLTRMSWIPIVRHTLIKHKNSPDDPALKRYFEYRDEHEFTRFNTASKRKIAKRCGFKCRVCKQSLVGNEKLEVNYIIPRILGGKDKYENLELLHASCYQQHQVLLDKYGGGKTLTKIQKFYDSRQITPISKEGINIMKEQFKLFRYL
jgi:RNA-directed DNA polymerase